jgi:hypothetical protein
MFIRNTINYIYRLRIDYPKNGSWK